jgi:hypothetical protein
LNGRLLREFSRLSVEHLRAALPLRLALPVLEPFLADNVEKEIRKDALVIRRAAEGPAPGAAREILAAAREIDRQFLARIGGLPVRIEIPYDRIEPLRLRRIELGLETARRILEAWRQGRRVRASFAAGELERMVLEMLRLYAEETQALSHSVRLPALLEPLRERLAQRLREAMSNAARALTRTAHVAGQNR